MKTVAVLGGGGTGCMMAADNTLRGNIVRLWEDKQFFHENLSDIESIGGIEVVGNGITGFAAISMITTDMEKAIEGADVILISAVSKRHFNISKELAPLLKSGQTVCFSAGNMGSIGLANMLKPEQDVVVGEMSGNCYPCRIAGKGKVSSAFPYKSKSVAAFPAQNTERLINNLHCVYECTPMRNVLEATLNSPNIVVHLAGSLLNTANIDKDADFMLYAQGLSEHTILVMEKVEAEKVRLMDAMGYETVMHVPMIKRVMEYDKHQELELFRRVCGPSSMDHRYITEDAAFGQSIFYSLAQMLGIHVPLTRSLITLASTINGEDYFITGITMEKLGMGGMDKEAINQYLLMGKTIS